MLLPEAVAMAQEARNSRYGAVIVGADLIAEDTRRAVRARRDLFSPESEARICAQVVGERRHGVLDNH
ncbi:hypothetical protein HUO13_36915 [Saccharopolyspora erythraea]|uniref:hypothetical protein n=1 Tax=Saccharopolyspora erythraea TaxID=1836 RepID=UPI001BA875A5|nr:hypothetical protein [Saccharopolyspora erythraea]QUH05620.1 hypothetical protein HUO13_36915 [Saccharopolyspora erythraea]